LRPEGSRASEGATPFHRESHPENQSLGRKTSFDDNDGPSLVLKGID
jgi:hypothetical protein